MPVRFLRKRLAPAAVLAATIVLVAATQSATAGSDALEPATVSVDFGSREGKLPRTERLNNFANPSAFAEQRPDDVAFLNEQDLHGDIYRVWLDDDADEGTAHDDLCDVKTNTCDFSPVADYMRDASNVSDSLLIVPMTRTMIEEKRPPAEAKPQLKMILKGLKERYPQIEYVEAFNEPDWHFHGSQIRAGSQPILQPEELYPYYVPVYEAVNEINEELRPEVPLKVGGPGLSWLDPKWMESFLDAYAADTNPRKRLDFLSYHAYLSWHDENYQRANPYKSDLNVVASDRVTIAKWLRERRIPEPVPSFVTETGIYPGPSFDDTDPKNDYIRQAAGMATYGYLYSNQPDTHMFNWVVRHTSEERKDQLVTRTPNGPVLDTFTPYGNMMLMQSKMKDTRVSAVSDAPLKDHDNGIYTTASKDQTGASLMVWNWQHVHDQSYRTTIDMSELPSELKNSPVRQRMFRIDQTTSNYFTNPAAANLQQVDEKIIVPGKTHTETINLTPNAIYLILLEPA